MGLLYGPSRLDGESDNASERWSVGVFFFCGSYQSRAGYLLSKRNPVYFFSDKKLNF